MAKIDKEIRKHLASIADLSGSIRGYSMDTKFNEEFQLSQDYCFWIYNGLIEDYQTIIYLLNGMADIEVFHLRPLYCILRSTLEKYADVSNFCTYGESYCTYLQFLNNESMGLKQEADQLAEQFAEEMKLMYCNRKTRYYVINYEPEMEVCHHQEIRELNKSLMERDSEYSRLLHNNIHMGMKANKDQVIAIIGQLNLMLYAASHAVCHMYQKKITADVFQELLNTLEEVLDEQITISDE